MKTLALAIAICSISAVLNAGSASLTVTGEQGTVFYVTFERATDGIMATLGERPGVHLLSFPISKVAAVTRGIESAEETASGLKPASGVDLEKQCVISLGRGHGLHITAKRNKDGTSGIGFGSEKMRSVASVCEIKKVLAQVPRLYEGVAGGIR